MALEAFKTGPVKNQEPIHVKSSLFT